MKTLIHRLLLLSLLAAGFSSCKKDRNTETDDSCAVPEYQVSASVDIDRPCALAVSASGLVAVTEYKQPYGSAGLTKLFASYSDLLAGKPPLQVWQNVAAEALAFDRNENLYVTETEATASIVIYRKTVQAGGISYQYLKRIQGGFNNPRGIAFDSRNRLYLADDGNDRLLRFDAPVLNDNFQIVAGVFGNPKGLAIAADTIYITGYNRNQIYKYGLTAAGRFGAGEAIALGKPVDVAISGTTLAIASPDAASITLYDSRKVKTNLSDAPCTKSLTTSGALYGLAFVSTPRGLSLLSAQHSRNKIVLYEPK
ncbi:NHL repeat-containing protein [Pedobacter yulinensis]|nr:hypothetical protein [Pedobacter yulinensis]